ncbi:MAG: diaminopimelate decarboxylase [Pseudomonadota bacterium]
MHEFKYQGDDLCGENVLIEKIAADVGTPFYVYSRKTLESHFRVFDTAFAAVPHITCYSAKSNANAAVLKVLSSLGSGVDVVSGGEIFRALRAGVAPRKIVYSGAGKTGSEIEYALQSDILQFNIESAQELDLIDAVAAKAGKKARIALRVNPDVDPKTHPYISTGLKKNKFGLGIEDAGLEYARAAEKKSIEITGIACHIGSQITETGPFVDAVRRVRKFINELLGQGIRIRYLDLGGGLGITYDGETPPAPAEYAAAIIPEIQGLPCTLILEPGRVIVGNAGILVSQVLYTKKSGAKNFIIIDAAMNDLVRPSLYDAYHEIRPVKKRQGALISADVVGPVCESGDFMARGRDVQDFVPGEYLAVMSAGAYGFSMSSNYNSRPRIPEVMVDESRYFVIRKRETYDDLVRNEVLPEHLRT